MQQIPTSVITLLVLSVLFWLFKRLSPPSTSKFHTDKPIEELRKKYLKFDLAQIGLLFGIAIILTFVYYNIFVALTDFRISLLENVLIAVKPLVSAWFLASMFTAMLTATILITYLLKLMLKDSWDEYMAYNDLKSGFNSKTVGSMVLKVFAVITAALVVGIFDWFTVFRSDDIVINDLFSVGSKTYHYAEIKDIRNIKKLEAPNGNIVEDEHYVIVFGNGVKWNTRKSGFGNLRDDSKIVELLEKKITELEFDRD